MEKSHSRALCRLLFFAVAALVSFPSARAAAKPAEDPPLQKFDARTFNVVLAVLPGWSAKIVKGPPGLLFDYVDEPARTDKATIGIFRLIVPSEVRDVDRVQLGRAYAIDDVSKLSLALFKVRINFMLTANTANAVGGGQLLSYAEEVDAKDGRSRTTKFVRAWVFFPQNYAKDGALYLVFGQETFRDIQLKPAQLERATEIIAGIHEP